MRQFLALLLLTSATKAFGQGNPMEPFAPYLPSNSFSSEFARERGLKTHTVSNPKGEIRLLERYSPGGALERHLGFQYDCEYHRDEQGRLTEILVHPRDRDSNFMDEEVEIRHIDSQTEHWHVRDASSKTENRRIEYRSDNQGRVRAKKTVEFFRDGKVRETTDTWTYLEDHRNWLVFSNSQATGNSLLTYRRVLNDNGQPIWQYELTASGDTSAWTQFEYSHFDTLPSRYERHFFDLEEDGSRKERRISVMEAMEQKDSGTYWMSVATWNGYYGRWEYYFIRMEVQEELVRKVFFTREELFPFDPETLKFDFSLKNEGIEMELEAIHQYEFH